MASNTSRATAQSVHIDEDQFGASAAKIDNLLMAAGALADKFVSDREAEAFHVLFRAIENSLDEIESIVFPGMVTRSGKVAPTPEPPPAPEPEPQLGPIGAELRETLIEHNARVCDLAMYLTRELDDKDSLKSLARALDRELFEFTELLYGNKPEQPEDGRHD